MGRKKLSVYVLPMMIKLLDEFNISEGDRYLVYFCKRLAELIIETTGGKNYISITNRIKDAYEVLTGRDKLNYWNWKKYRRTRDKI